MKPHKLLFKVIVLAFILFTSCIKDVKTNDSPASNQQPTERATLLKQTILSPAELKEQLYKLNPVLAMSEEKRGEPTSSISTAIDQECYLKMAGRFNNVIEPTPCNPNTPLNQWLDRQFSDWNDDIINFASITSMFEMPALYEYFFANSSANQYFGINGSTRGF